MLRRLLFYRDLPIWMERTHPMMRREIKREVQRSTPYSHWLKGVRWLSALTMVSFLLMIGYTTVDMVTNNNQALSISEIIFAWQLFPLYFVHFLLLGGTFIMGVDTLKNQKRLNLWDEVRATSDGVRLIVWVRWAYLTFYHNSLLLKITYVVRVLMILALLMDLTSFGGNYLSYLLLQSTPNLPLWVGVILVGMNITAGLLLPLSMMSLTSSFALLLSTYFKQPILNLFIKFVVLIFYMFISLFLVMLLSTLYLETAQESASILMNNPLGEFGGLLAIITSLFVDWGTTLLFLGFLGEHLWVNIPYSVFIGAGMLFVIIAQAYLSELLLRYAIHRANNNT
jgi:hypothetical protein